ncbi:MAG: hypothetical protein IT376_22210 [Polyangiaceae bacterium]|nr:hypothetical protein [Polyangiaceae bacterium]
MNQQQRSEVTIVRQTAARFARDVLVPARHALLHHPDEALPAGLLDGLLGLGLHELGLEEEGERALLGAGLEELSRVAAAPASLVLAHVIARECLRQTGALERAPAAEGAGALLALPLYAEPGLGDEGPSLRQDGAAIVLDGIAELVVGAPLAGAAVLVARDAGDRERPALVLAPLDAPGVSVGPALLTLGMRGAPTADVRFSKARLPATARLAGATESGVVARDAARRARGPALAIAAGVVEASLRTATEYARERYQGGKQIVDHQEVRALLAGMVEDLALCAEAAELLCGDALAESRALALFARAKRRAAHATCDGVQLLGGNGYMEDYDQERCLRDAKQAQALLGRTDLAAQAATEAWLAEGAGS